MTQKVLEILDESGFGAGCGFEIGQTDDATTKPPTDEINLSFPSKDNAPETEG